MRDMCVGHVARGGASQEMAGIGCTCVIACVCMYHHMELHLCIIHRIYILHSRTCTSYAHVYTRCEAVTHTHTYMHTCTHVLLGSFRLDNKMHRFESHLLSLHDHGVHDDVHYDIIQGQLVDELDFEQKTAWPSTHEANREAAKTQAWTRVSIHPLGRWQREMLGLKPTGKQYSWHFMFAVGKGRIMRYSRAEYERWRKLVADGGPNGEIIHYFERSMYGLFQ